MGDYDRAFQVIEERHLAETKALRDEITRLKSTDQSAGWRETVNKLKAEILDRDKEIERLNELLQSFESAPVSKPRLPKKKAAHT